MSAKKNETVVPVQTMFGSVFALITCGFLLVLRARASMGQVIHLWDLAPWILWSASSLIVVITLHLGKYDGAKALPGLILLLSGLGVLIRSRMMGSVESLDGFYLLIQPIGLMLLLGVWSFFRKGRVRPLRPMWGLAVLLSFAIVGGLFLVGNKFRGALYGPGGMTPTELLKLCVPMALAGFFARTETAWTNRSVFSAPWGALSGLGFFWAGLCGLLVLQRDMGMIVLLSLALLILLVCVTRSWSWLVAAGLALIPAALLVIRFFAHGARRVEAWRDPFVDPTGSGWQVLQGLSGLYAGGLTGTGLGGGRPDRLPIAGSDFIYAVYGEELGFVGCIFLLLVYALIFRQGIKTAAKQTELFSFVLCAGITTLFALQVIVNIAGVVTLLPVTGITLPYLSQGGSSHWVISVQFGLLLAMSEPGEKPKLKKKKSRKRG